MPLPVGTMGAGICSIFGGLDPRGVEGVEGAGAVDLSSRMCLLGTWGAVQAHFHVLRLSLAYLLEALVGMDEKARHMVSLVVDIFRSFPGYTFFPSLQFLFQSRIVALPHFSQGTKYVFLAFHFFYMRHSVPGTTADRSAVNALQFLCSDVLSSCPVLSTIFHLYIVCFSLFTILMFE